MRRVPPLDALIRQAESLGAGRPEVEVARVMQICNACRYCEGFCAVFPAMTRRLEFPAADRARAGAVAINQHFRTGLAWD